MESENQNKNKNTIKMLKNKGSSTVSASSADDEEYMDVQDIPVCLGLKMRLQLRLTCSETVLPSQVFPPLPPPAASKRKPDTPVDQASPEKKKPVQVTESSDKGQKNSMEKLEDGLGWDGCDEDGDGQDALRELQGERKSLEVFLFNESNKITKAAIKFILDKWMKMENRLVTMHTEHEILEATHKCCGVGPSLAAAPVGMTFAQVVGPAAGMSQSVKEKEKSPIRQRRSEVVLIRPVEESETRSSEQIKKAVVEQLKKVKNKIKIVGFRQMRNPGLVMKVNGEEDVEALKKSGFDGISLKIERPKKIAPLILVYDIEKDYDKQELIEDLLDKNFDLTDEECGELKKQVYLRTCFGGNDGRENWIIQLPGRYAGQLIKQGRVFLRWRTYKVREFNNITRCYKCNAYGHIARVCEARDLRCGQCACTGHIATDCTSEQQRCSNCVRAKRKEVNHDVGGKGCLEYLKQVQIYKEKLEWS